MSSKPQPRTPEEDRSSSSAATRGSITPGLSHHDSSASPPSRGSMIASSHLERGSRDSGDLLEKEDCQTVLESFLPESLRFWEGLDVLEKPATDFEKMMAPVVKNVIAPGVHGANANFAYYHKVVLNHAKFAISTPGGAPASEVKKDLFDMMADLSAKRQELDKNLKNWTECMENALAMQQACAKRREDYRTERELYSTKMKKYLNTKPDHARATARDEKMMKFRRKMEMDRYDLRDGLVRLLYHRWLYASKPVSMVLRAYLEFFTEGFALIKPLQALIEELEKNVALEEAAVLSKDRVYTDAREVFKTKYEAESQIDMQSPASKLTARDFEAAASDTTTRAKQGYLFVHQPKLSQVWVELKEGQLFVREETAGGGRKEKKEAAPPVIYPPMHMLLCTVKTPLDAKIRFSFDVISAGKEPLTLQADSQKNASLWETAIQNAIAYQLNNQKDTTPAGQAKSKARQELVQKLWEKPGNNVCADCQHAEPDWVSLNLGILICMGCSGFHRAMGVHISQVRSLQLDDLDAHRVRYLFAVGNVQSNRIWEAELDPEMRPKQDGSRAELERFVRHKYLEKGFVSKEMRAMDGPMLSEKLYEAIQNQDPIAVLSVLAWGADVNSSTDEVRTPLLQAVKSGNQLIVDQLYLNGAQLNKPNKRGWTAMHIAADMANCSMVDLLLLRGGREMIFAQDEKGITPADRARLAHQPAPWSSTDHSGEGDDDPPPVPLTSPPDGEDDEILLGPPPVPPGGRGSNAGSVPVIVPPPPPTPSDGRNIVQMLQTLLDSETKRRTEKMEQDQKDEAEKAQELAELEAAKEDELKNSTSAKLKGLGAKFKAEFTEKASKGLSMVGQKMSKGKEGLGSKIRSPAGPPTPGGLFKADMKDPKPHDPED